MNPLIRLITPRLRLNWVPYLVVLVLVLTASAAPAFYFKGMPGVGIPTGPVLRNTPILDPNDPNQTPTTQRPWIPSTEPTDPTNPTNPSNPTNPNVPEVPEPATILGSLIGLGIVTAARMTIRSGKR